MSNASSPNSINQLKHLNPASSLSLKKSALPAPQQPNAGPEIADAVDISFSGKEIGGLPRLDLKKMSPQELLNLTKKVFDKFDLDGDGKVSRREANKMGVPQETFDRYDLNGDGMVGLRKEFVPTLIQDLHASGQISGAQCLNCLKEVGGIGLVMKGFLDMFRAGDLNGDQQITMREASQFGVTEEQFKQGDLDGDGKISLFGEFLPGVADQLHGMGVLNDREYDKLMTRIKNAAQGQQDPGPDADPEIEVKPAENRRREPRKIEDPIQIREHAERWLRARDLDVRSLEDIGRRLFGK